MNYEVKLEEFEGPLDLLLHLVKKENIDIFDISIEKIIKQYLDYIEKLKKERLDITSEYLVMAAELMELKSKLLLPNKTEEEIEEIEEAKNELFDRITEYEKYKAITPTLKELEKFRSEVYTRDSDEILNYCNNDNIDYGIALKDLMNAFKNFLVKKELDKPLNTKVTKKEYSINQRCQEIRKIILLKKELNFEDLFENYNKGYIVVTFLAILSMMKKQEIIVTQQNNFNDILIKIKE